MRNIKGNKFLVLKSNLYLYVNIWQIVRKAT